MNSARVLLAFIVVCLLLLLTVSLVATHALATLFIADALVAWAFALGIELGIVGLGIGIFHALETGQDPRPYSYTLVGVLTLSVVANFLHGADTFNPLAGLFDWVKKLPAWWLLPLLFAAPVPVLVLRMTELATRLALQATRTTTSNREQLVASNDQLPDLVVEVVRIYQEQPATPLPKLAEKLSVSPTEASRLRLQAMNLQLLQRKSRGHYVALVPADQIPLEPFGKRNGHG